MQKLNISYEPPKKKIYGSKRFVKAMVNYLRKSILQSTVFLNFLRQCINALFCENSVNCKFFVKFSMKTLR